MIYLNIVPVIICITLVWVFQRAFCAIKNRKIDWKRELQLLLVYVCIVVIARFVLFPFSKVDGKVQPLIFDPSNAFPPRINYLPLVYLFDYPEVIDIIKNVVGNVAMFIPVGIVFPAVYKELRPFKKSILAGFLSTLTIEILQLPFYQRLSDVDDLILNTLGYVIGYGIFVLVYNTCVKKKEK